MGKLTIVIVSIGLISMLAVGCSDNNKDTQPQTGMLMLNFSGLENLGSDYAYEGWILVDGSPVSTGVFTVDDNGNLSQSSFEMSLSNLEAATKFILTIEPSPDSDPSPASTHYLAGDFSNGTANLMVGDAAALGDDFTSAEGEFILNTPSTGNDNTDYASGIWWLDPANAPNLAPTLVLPDLPDGWVYEGWVVGGSGPVTTGRFTAVSGYDSDQGGPTAGPDGVPEFPGQDYINPMMNLIGDAAVITIEPEPDNSAGPFTLKPLVDSNIEDVGIGVLQGMGNNADGFPTGTASW